MTNSKNPVYSKWLTELFVVNLINNLSSSHNFFTAWSDFYWFNSELNWVIVVIRIHLFINYMYFKFTEPKLNAQLILTDNVGLISDGQSLADGLIHIYWNRSELEVKVLIDIHLYCCKAVNWRPAHTSKRFALKNMLQNSLYFPWSRSSIVSMAMTMKYLVMELSFLVLKICLLSLPRNQKQPNWKCFWIRAICQMERSNSKKKENTYISVLWTLLFNIHLS